MGRSLRGALLAAAAIIAIGAAPVALAAGPDVIIPAPTAKDWADVAQLPDWSGVWTPDFLDQVKQEHTNRPPWAPTVAKQLAQQAADENAGKPFGPFINCLPEGMPSWMLISHNALEFLFTPGRVTLLGESDGNRLRRIYTDGRPHPDDPDPSFHGHSIGHWEGDTLVVDTIGVLPQAFIATSESAAMPNNGDMHIVERIHLTDANTLHDDLEITAPHVFSAPWKTTRIFYRHRARKDDIVEGVCLQGSFGEQTDKDGNAVYVPLSQDNGNVVPPPK